MGILVIGLCCLAWFAIIYLCRRCKFSWVTAIGGGLLVVLIALVLTFEAVDMGRRIAVAYAAVQGTEQAALDLEDAKTNLKAAGFLFVALIVVSVMFGRILFALPFGGALLGFGLILSILLFGLGIFHLTAAWGFSEQGQTYVKYGFFATVYVFLQILAIWAYMAKS